MAYITMTQYNQELNRLRNNYFDKLGINPYNKWNIFNSTHGIVSRKNIHNYTESFFIYACLNPTATFDRFTNYDIKLKTELDRLLQRPRNQRQLQTLYVYLEESKKLESKLIPLTVYLSDTTSNVYNHIKAHIVRKDAQLLWY